MNIINIRPIHCLKQLPIHIVVKFMQSVVWDKHHLLHPLGSLNVLIKVGDGVSRYVSCIRTVWVWVHALLIYIGLYLTSGKSGTIHDIHMYINKLINSSLP